MFDIILFFIIAFAGGIIALVGFITIIGRRISEPKRELQQKVDKLENEVRQLKNKK
ncbi:hypothetical protein [Bacillus sp. FJAT-45350]|uniref:hypothetical protein n=1 Tax=Bacillus sp. FJAT-45350 TaxID=2011014 RepID=UPI0015CDB841|nr:hypothetical protein [Bacillus sp. FJAT-45350]